VEQPTDGTPDFDLTDNAERHRWELRDGDEVIAYAEYRAGPGRMIFTHTVVQPEYEGRGIGSRIARSVLDDAVARGLRITPRCPFIRSYIERHPEYAPSADLPDAR
jgi:predicted GNAT family acetyltransferase